MFRLSRRQIIGHVIDVVKDDFGFACRGNSRIEVTDGPRRRIARVFERFRCRLVVFFQHRKTNDRLSAHFERPPIGNLHGKGTNGQNLRGYVLARNSVAARGGAHELAVLIGQTAGQPVEFIFHGIFGMRADLGYAREKSGKFFFGNRLIQTVQPHDMVVAGKRLDRFAAHATGGTVKENDAALRFQALQLRIQFIVFRVGNGRIVQNIIFIRPAVERGGQFLLPVCRLLHTSFSLFRA